MYYKQSILFDRPVGNNIFIYDERKELFGKAELTIPVLLEGSLDDIQLGDTIVFAEKIDGEVREFTGLKDLVCMKGDTDISVYVLDNHNHALYCRYTEVLAGRVERGLSLIHIDQHSDMKDPVGWIDTARDSDLDYIAAYVNEICTIADFIQPALRTGLVSECVQVRTEYGLLHYEVPEKPYVLDIDIDFWAIEMSIGEFDRTIQKTRQLIARASMVTIATSPCFIDQKRAVEIVSMLLT